MNCQKTLLYYAHNINFLLKKFKNTAKKELIMHNFKEFFNTFFILD